MQRNRNSSIEKTHRIRKSTRMRHNQLPTIAILLLFAVAPPVQADPYEVLVVDIARANDVAKMDEFKKSASKFNALNRQGYAAARPYFNVLHMADGQVYFLFGFRDEVQGIHRHNYPGAYANLRRTKYRGAPKYPHMHWKSVEEIRRLLTAP
jgi:hypothetical protein